MPGFNVELGNARDYFQLGSLFRAGYNLDADYGVNKVNTAFDGGMPYSDKFSIYFFVGLLGASNPLTSSFKAIALKLGALLIWNTLFMLVK
ncbi:DUF2219 family protein [Helicobacter pylori]|nr:DUF2219 family protein [Helicobacter pylori]